MFRVALFAFAFFFFYFASFSISVRQGINWKFGAKIVVAQVSDKEDLKKTKASTTLRRPQTVNVETLRLIERIETKTKELKKREEAVKLKEQQLKDLEKKVKKDLKKIEDAINQGQVLLGISEDLNQENLDLLVNIFVPTTPNPTTGFTVVLPKEKIIPLGFPVEQGLKMIVSVGMFNPGVSKNDSNSDLSSKESR